MLNLKILKRFVLIAIALTLAACGNGENGGTASPTILSGKVADGYLGGAKVFLDRDGDKVLDADEPWTLSEAGGVFNLEVAAGEEMLYPVVADIIAGQTVDEDLPGAGVAENYTLEAPVGGWTFISPLTTLVKAEMDKNPGLSLGAAEERIRSRYGLGNGATFSEDYLDAQAGSDAETFHRAARIIAGLMGGLCAEIEGNVGTPEMNARKAALVLLISDQIANSGTGIAQAIPTANDTVAIEAAMDSILAGIDTTRLDAALLDRYVERMQQGNPVWDMSPPQVTSQVPPAAGTASVDGIITLHFDEALDPASITDNSLQILGPGGPITGTVSYDPALKQLSFVPDQLLTAFSDYQVQLTGIMDQAGNPLDQTISWNFTTIFDQQPPALPRF